MYGLNRLKTNNCNIIGSLNIIWSCIFWCR